MSVLVALSFRLTDARISMTQKAANVITVIRFDVGLANLTVVGC